MKFSVSWLREWVPIHIPTRRLCDQLTNAGLEVDNVAGVAGEFSGVMVAEIVEVRRHPRADKLSICEVDSGAGKPLSVVCGAGNVRPGLKSAFAEVGARLPGDVAISAAKLRGVASNGMLCSADELGLGEDADGILELDAEAEIGADLRAALDLDDVAIDLDLTPNRGDCLSIRGLAREVGLLNDVPVSPPRITPLAATSAAVFPIEIANHAGCPRYLGRVIEGVDMARPAPWWLRERLRRCGLRSINPVVDVTNYVLLELGQPMHAFDLDQLADGIVVRDARAGETLTLLDGRQAAAPPTTLLITDGNGPVAIGGVMGGERSGVSASTRNVFLECAFFSPIGIAATARRLGLRSDAAHRYERGVDYQLQAEAMERATALLLEITGGSAGPVVAAVSDQHLPQPRTVTLRKARLDHLVGEAIPGTEVERILERLDLAPMAAGGADDKAWTTTSPSHRFDIEREEDLVEEVLRIHGYNTVPSRVPAAPLVLGQPPSNERPAARLADLLVDLGYSEAVTYSFISPRLADLLDPGAESIGVLNPVSSEHATMRTNLLPGLVGALRNNLVRQADRVRLFEIGQCFRLDQDGGLDQGAWCGGILFGRRDEESWAHPAAEVDFFDVKGDAERVLALGGRDVAFTRAADPVLHPGQSARVSIDGEPVGRLGRLHPEVEAALDLPAGVFVFELAVSALLAVHPRRHASLSRQPSVRRDLALMMDRGVAAADIEAAVRTILRDVLVDFRLFDVYAGKGIDPNRKSVAIGLTLQHPTRTLNDAEINRYMDATLNYLTFRHGVCLR